MKYFSKGKMQNWLTANAVTDLNIYLCYAKSHCFSEKTLSSSFGVVSNSNKKERAAINITLSESVWFAIQTRHEIRGHFYEQSFS